jgi:hypothetical protein
VGAQINEKNKEPEKYRILTRSRALVDAIEDEDSSDEEGNEALMGGPTSFNEAYYHKVSGKRKDEKSSQRGDSRHGKCKV